MTRDMCFLIFIVLIGHCFGDKQCGPSEQLNTCPSACTTGRCPESHDEFKNCSDAGKCLESRCDCQFNYRRAANNTCIPIASCPKFNCTGANEEYVACPPYCPTDDCSQATPDGHCRYFWSILFVVECRPSCRCIEGFWRNKGVCVPYNKCPKT
ncbi:inducible metalloproteinase inhibitor protein-like [Bombyx mandarina]|uniref:Inducible metalloproteinase inhibitor protein-like n=1 Tax=Bombyx mandarina TaxID=7092 RepID=A0A6J2JCX6_BOMMA|nr:inducible metalloproteinase inhibitor protein-like [Bombyx mandarina]